MVKAPDPKALSQELVPFLAEEYARIRNKCFGGLCRLPSGKPVFASEDGMHLSVSHSSTHLAVVFASVPVGVDVEAKDCDRPAVAARFFTKQEKIEPFSHIWTAREAVGKLTGGGLSHALGCHIIHAEGYWQKKRYALIRFDQDDQVVTIALPASLSASDVP